MSYRVSILLGFSLFACSEPNGSEAPPSALERDIDARIDTAVDGGFSGSILVVVKGERIALDGFGFADRARELENTVDTAFDVGSLMKNLTATAIYALAEDGELSLDDALERFFPDVPSDKAKITLRELVQHTAGFDEYHDTEGDFEAMSRSEARARIFEQELLFAPGTDEAYSNSGYTLLADVVETVSGQSFTELVHQRLLEPAGMDHTGFYSEPIWQTVETAIGYGAETFQDNDPASWPYTWALVGNGGLVSTVVDLEKWTLALFGGKLLNEGTLEAMREDYLSRGAAELSGSTVYSAAGAGDFGLGGVVVDIPARDTRIIVATNAYDDFDVESFALSLVERVQEEL
jgi:CubicO group peptidase (beta-lactamase class C family)